MPQARGAAPSCSLCLHTSIGVMIRSCTIVPIATAAPAPNAASRAGTATAAAPSAVTAGLPMSHFPISGLKVS